MRTTCCWRTNSIGHGGDAERLSLTDCEFAGSPFNVIDVHNLESALLVGNLGDLGATVISSNISRMMEQTNRWP